jgi:hypothetical protein
MFDCVYRDEVKQKIKKRMKYLDDARIMNKGDTETLNQIKGFEKALNHIYCDIDDIRTADVQPVKHGRWFHINNDSFIYCSECNNEAYWDTDYGQQLFDYCPYCGAKMIKDGDVE